MTSRPVVLFVCVRNAGRSQMAEAIFNDRAGDSALGRSAGSDPATALHEHVVEAMAEIGIDVSSAVPKPLTREVTTGVDIVVTMGCGDACPVIPGATVEDWDLPDPADLDAEGVSRVRDEIARRVDVLLYQLTGELRR